MIHSETVEKKEQEHGYYPQITRCAVCGYPIIGRKGILLLAGTLASVLGILVVIVTGPVGLHGILLLVFCTFGVFFLGIVTEMELRRFYRAQRKAFLERQ